MLPVIGIFLIICGMAIPIVAFTRNDGKRMKEKNS